MEANDRLPMCVAALLVILGACGAPDDEQMPSPVAAPTTSTAATTTTSTTVAPTTTTTVAPTTSTTTEPTPTTSTLPGRPYEFAVAGVVADVAGVAFDEMFVIRTLPGDGQPVAASLPPLTQLVLTGQGREIDQGEYFVPWVGVTAGGVTGWISQWSLVYLGAPQDITADVVSAVGVWPAAPTMLELGKIVTDATVQPDPDFPPAEIVVVTRPTAGTTSEVVYDGFPGEAFGDDAASGGRYRVVGRQVPAGDLPATGFAGSVVYELVSVEVSSLCTRGASSGVCV